MHIFWRLALSSVMKLSSFGNTVRQILMLDLPSSTTPDSVLSSKRTSKTRCGVFLRIPSYTTRVAPPVPPSFPADDPDPPPPLTWLFLPSHHYQHWQAFLQQQKNGTQKRAYDSEIPLKPVYIHGECKHTLRYPQTCITFSPRLCLRHLHRRNLRSQHFTGPSWMEHGLEQVQA